jgi:hypothetical protein
MGYFQLMTPSLVPRYKAVELFRLVQNVAGVGRKPTIQAIDADRELDIFRPVIIWVRPQA